MEGVVGESGGLVPPGHRRRMTDGTSLDETRVTKPETCHDPETPMDRTRSQTTEESQLERAGRGEVEAFSDLVRAHHPAVRVFLAAHLRDSAAIDDLVQDVFLRAFDRLSTLRDGTAFRAWLLGIARNRALEHLRERLRSGLPAPDALDTLLDRSQLAILEGDDEEARRGLELEALRQCIRRLPPVGARLIREHYFKGRPINALAAEERKNEGALRMTLLRLREALRDCVRRRIAAPSET
jgi:RNA polymerase sigma-70 factor (ECF subfamily)